MCNCTILCFNEKNHQIAFDFILNPCEKKKPKITDLKSLVLSELIESLDVCQTNCNNYFV